MENNVLISIWTNPDFTEEEKTLLSKKIAEELKEQKAKEALENNEVHNRYKNQAKETKLRIGQHNLDSRINEMVGILSHIEGKAGSIIYTKEELDKMDQFDLEQLFQGYSSRNPLALEKAREKYYQEREKAESESNNVDETVTKLAGKDIDEKPSETEEKEKAESESKTEEKMIKDVKDSTESNKPEEKEINNSAKNALSLAAIATKLGTEIEDLPAIAKRKKLKKSSFNKPPRLEENLKRLRNNKPSNDDDFDNQRIINEEDGSRFTKVKGFFKKHWKKVLVVGAAIGGAALVYFMLKHGITPDEPPKKLDVPDVEPLPKVDEVVEPEHSEFIDSLSSHDVGEISVTRDANQYVIDGTHAETPNEWHQNELINAVDSSDNVYPVEDREDVAELIEQGKDITSLEVGGPVDGTMEIDGHVDTIDGKPIDEYFNKENMEQFRTYKSGGVK